jgi:oligopeptide transport system substrate-binding protein
MPNRTLRVSLALPLVLIVPMLLGCVDPIRQTAPFTPAPTIDLGATAAPAPTNTPAAVSGNALRIAQPIWPDNLDPQIASFSTEIGVLNLNYEGLTAFDEDLQTVPAAAESWEYNADTTAITFTLRDDLKYSDGSPLVAQDFVNAARRWLDPRNAGDYQSALEMVKGAAAILATTVPTDEAKLPGLFDALAIKATSDTTIVVEFSRPTPYFHTLAALWGFYPAKQELIRKGGKTWWQDAANHIGNGPFQIIRIAQGESLIEYQANDRYWQGRPKLDGIQLRYIVDASVALQAYMNDEIDIMRPDPNDIPTIKADPVLSKQLQEYAGACTLAIQFNLTNAPFNNKKVREAFAYGFDREGYARDMLKGTEVPTLTWIPPGYPGYDPNETRFAYDPAKAKAALAEAGFLNGEGLPEIKYTYTSSNPANQARAEYIVQMYQTSLGVTLVPDPVEATTLTSLQKSAKTFPQMITGGWCADYPDPQNWLSIYWHSRTNFAKRIGYQNVEADKLMDEADVEPNPGRRAALYAQAQDLIVGDVARVMRSNNLNTYLIKPYVKGLDFTAQDSSYPGQETGLLSVWLEK